jgi:cytochrome c oxidase cbb3-type subunit 1
MQADVISRHADLSDEDPRALRTVFSAYVISATLWLLFGTGVGLLVALKFWLPDFGAGPWLTLGRLRPIHTNSVFYGFASIALVGLGYYVAARSSGTKLYSAALAWIGLGLFNVAAVAGTVALDIGYNNGDLEYREWPWPIRLIFLAALVVTAWNLIGTVARYSVDLHHCGGGDLAVVPVWAGAGGGVRLLHAQRGGHLVYAVGPRGDLLHAA